MKKETNDIAAAPTAENRMTIVLEQLRDCGSAIETILRNTEQVANLLGHQSLTGIDRMRLRGSGIRRYGFIMETCEVAHENTEFLPPFVDIKRFESLIEEIKESQNIVIALNQLSRIYGDLLLTAGDDAYRLALMYYRLVQDASRRGTPGAQPIYQRLKSFFHRNRQPSDQPTVAQTLRDAKALLHGTKDGQIIIKGQTSS